MKQAKLTDWVWFGIVLLTFLFIATTFSGCTSETTKKTHFDKAWMI